MEATPYCLQSMFYIGNWELEYIHQFEFFMLDSGAFTFMNNQNHSSIDFDKFVVDYANFINKNNIDNFIELDIDSIVGLQRVEKYRSFLERETGKKPIPVWHRNRGIQYFKDCCREYPYVAIGGLVVNEYENIGSLFDMFPYFISYAHHCGAKIHGLGFTKLNRLSELHFDSVDSTAWMADARFGRSCYLDVQRQNEFVNKQLGVENVPYLMVLENSLKRWKNIVEHCRCFY